MNGKNAEQRWGEICRSWGIGAEDTQGLVPRAALDTLEHILAQEDLTVAVRASQMLLADPEDPGTRDRAAFNMLCAKFPDEAWRSAGVGTRAPWMLQALLVAAWPDFGVATNVAALFDTTWLGRASTERQMSKLEEWRERVVIGAWGHSQKSEAEHPQVEKDSVQEVLRGLNDGTLANAAFDVFGPLLITVLSAMHQDLLGFQGYCHESGDDDDDFESKILNLQSGAANWTFNHYAKDLLSILAAMISACRHEGYYISTVPMNHLEKGRTQAWAFSNAVAQITDLFEGIVSAIRRQMGIANVINPLRVEIDLLWWGQAGYCHRLRKPFRKIGDHGQRLLFAAAEAAQRSTALPPEPSAAYLVQTLKSLGLDASESKTLGDWMSVLHGALNDSCAAIPMSPTLTRLVADDPLGLPVSFVRQLASNKDPFRLEDARRKIGLDLDIQIDQGDWASWSYREWRLDGMCGDEE